jgi:hypothetical protein
VQSLKRSKGFFGMHLFDTLDPGVLATKVPFYITFLIVAFATYVLSALGFAFVHDTNLKDGFSGFKLRFSRRERGHGKSPKQTEWNEQRTGSLRDVGIGVVRLLRMLDFVWIESM